MQNKPCYCFCTTCICDNGWISVKDKLPEKEGEYLTYCYGSRQIQRFGHQYESGKKISDKMDWIEHGYSYLTSHWMPLPPIPEK